jgi:aryl-alcohol dehydrogenase-like predicted oxidoreductase
VREKLVWGTAALGLAYGLGRDGRGPALMEEADAVALVKRAQRESVAIFDTAPAYGLAEERLGLSLGAAGTVWTKVGRHDALQPGLAEALQEGLDVSLRKLRRPQVELLQWHNWTRAVGDSREFQRGWEAIGRAAGVRALGASTYGVEDAVAAVTSGLFRVVQVEWNVLNQAVVAAVAEEARRRGVAIAVRSVFLQGALTDDRTRTLPELPRLRDAVQQARAFATREGLGLGELALRSALAHPDITHVLVGVEQNRDILEAVGAAAKPALQLDITGLSKSGDASVDPRTWPRS